MQARIPKRPKAPKPQDSDDEAAAVEAPKRRRMRTLPFVAAPKPAVQSRQQAAAGAKSSDGFYDRARLQLRALVPIQPRMALASEHGSGDEDGGVLFDDYAEQEGQGDAADDDDGDVHGAVQAKGETQQPAGVSDVLEAGTLTWYFDRKTNSEVLAQVVAVDRTIDPPGYTILLPDGREKSTERGRLRVLSTPGLAANPVPSAVPPAVVPSIVPPAFAGPAIPANPPTATQTMPSIQPIQPIVPVASLAFGLQKSAPTLGAAVAPQPGSLPPSLPGAAASSPMAGMPGFLPGAQVPGMVPAMPPFFLPFPMGMQQQMPVPDFAASVPATAAAIAAASSSPSVTTPAATSKSLSSSAATTATATATATATTTQQQIKSERKSKPAPAMFPTGAIPKRWDQPVDPRVKRRQQKESKLCGRVRSAFPLLNDLKLLRYTRLDEGAFKTIAQQTTDAQPNDDEGDKAGDTGAAVAGASTSANSISSSDPVPMDGSALLQMLRSEQTADTAATTPEQHDPATTARHEPIELIGDDFFHLLCGALCVDAQLWADTLKQRLVRLNPTTWTLPGETQFTTTSTDKAPNRPSSVAPATTPSELLDCLEHDRLHALPDQLLLQCWPYELMHVKVVVFDFGEIRPEQLDADEAGVILQMPDALEIRSYEPAETVRGLGDRGRMIYLWIVRANNQYFQLSGPTTGDAMFQSLLRDVGLSEGNARLVQYFHHKLNFVLFPDGTTACRRWELERGSIPRLLGTREERMMAQLQASNARLRAFTVRDDEKSQTFTGTPPTALRTAFCTEHMTAPRNADEADNVERAESVKLGFAHSWLHSGFEALPSLPGSASAHVPAAIHRGQTLYLLSSEELAADSAAQQQEAGSSRDNAPSTLEVIGDFVDARRWYAARDAQRKADFKERYGYPHDYELVLNKLPPDPAAPACATLEQIDASVVTGRSKKSFVDPNELTRRLRHIRAAAAAAK